jgi:hypothetical protein
MPHAHRCTAIALALATVAVAPSVWADKATTPPAAAASASGGVTGDPAPAGTTDATPAPAGDAAKPKGPPVAPEPPSSSSTDVTEKPGERYFFIGLRYRGDVIPQFLVNAFAAQGGTFYSHIFGIEADIRKDNFSVIPALTYESYGTGGPVLFLQKGKDPTNQGNWSEIDSSLGAVFATVDLLWSAKVHPNIDFEYGLGVGLGIVTGNLVDNWVYANPSGPLKSTPTSPASGFTNFSPCQTIADGGPNSGCNPMAHTDPNPNKVGGFKEFSIFSGGARPPILPWLSIPQLGLRIKAVKQFEARVQLGLALTGFWFGFSANYGLEKTEKK